MRRLTNPHVAIVAAAAATILAIVAVGRRYGVQPGDLTRDPLAIADIPPLYGLLSNLGVLIWCFTASACVLGGRLLQKAGRDDAARYLLASGAITVMLLLDDFFQIHEIVAPQYFGVPEKAVYALYMAAMAAYVLLFSRFLRNAETPLLVLAFAFFASSVSLDTVLEHLSLGRHLGIPEIILEDGAKFLGICCWCGYFVRRFFQMVQAAQRENSSAPAAPAVTRYAAPDNPA